MTALQTLAHESGDGVAIMHCPFCGSGQVIGRSDGNAECSFCNSAFMVRVQPQYSAFPQSVGGMPVDIPGMPAPAPAPGMDPNAMGAPDGAEGAPEDGAPPFGQDEGAPPADGGQGAADGPPGDGGGDEKDDDDGGGGPPFGKKKSGLYRTASGQHLDHDGYVDYLAALAS